MNSIRSFIRTILETKLLVSENLQLADKVYFKPGKLSPRVREVIIDKITGGDPYTKIVTDIYYAILQDGHVVGDWALRSLDNKNAEIDRTDNNIENDVLKIDNLKLVKSYYQQLKAYNKNVFPIKDYNPNGVKDVMGLIRTLRQRAMILEKIQALPKIALSNMRADIRTPRDSNEMNNYRDRLEYFLSQYSLLSNREGRMKSVIDKKMFKSNITLEDLIDFADEKENLIGGKKLNKAAIKKIISENDDELQVVYEKGNKVVVEVTGPSGIKAIGCNSVWCFTYGPGIYRQGGSWEQNSTNDHVYVIIDFSEESDSPYFMYVLVKPLDFQSEADMEDGDQKNDGKMADMSNNFTDNPLGVIYDFMTPEEAYMIFNFGEHRDGPTSKWPFENPNQLKLDLQEQKIRRIVRETLSEIQESHLLDEIERRKSWKKEITQVAKQLNVSLTNYLGDGIWGIAYEIPGNKVLKITEDEREIDNAKHLVGKKNKLLADIYKVYSIKGIKDKKVIIQEKLAPLTKEYMKALDIFGGYFNDFYNEEWTWGEMRFNGWEEDFDNELKTAKYDGIPLSDIYSELLQILDEAGENGIDLTDMHEGNLGMKNGHLAAFDLS